MLTVGSGVSMETFFISLSTVAIAEMGDRTQLLSLVLAARFRKPWPIIAAIFAATLVNHAIAGEIGIVFSSLLSPPILHGVVGVSMLAMAAWTLIPDKLEGETKTRGGSAFIATLIAFFVAEIGDKTQIATMALAAGYSDLFAVVGGTTAGMLMANVPVVFLGSAFASKLPLRAIHYAASALFAGLGLYFMYQAISTWL